MIHDCILMSLAHVPDTSIKDLVEGKFSSGRFLGNL
jgi:hypothetical protein